ncbi:MAG: phage holin family protein [Nitrospiraceae bacterium]
MTTRFAIVGIAVFLAIAIVPGIEVQTWSAGLAAVLVLSFLNAVVRPILYLFSLPLIVLSLGLFMIIINALLLQFAGYLVKGFIVDGFWPSVGGALVIGLVNAILTFALAGRHRVETLSHSSSPPRIVNPE